MDFDEKISEHLFNIHIKIVYCNKTIQSET